jgi:hypothetical protein
LEHFEFTKNNPGGHDVQFFDNLVQVAQLSSHLPNKLYLLLYLNLSQLDSPQQCPTLFFVYPLTKYLYPF